MACCSRLVAASREFQRVYVPTKRMYRKGSTMDRTSRCARHKCLEEKSRVAVAPSSRRTYVVHVPAVDGRGTVRAHQLFYGKDPELTSRRIKRGSSVRRSMNYSSAGDTRDSPVVRIFIPGTAANRRPTQTAHDRFDSSSFIQQNGLAVVARII